MANLRVTELDFDSIKTNLKSFLTTYQDSDGNPLFSDFSFEGSNWSILLDLLAYNTHYNAYLANMLMSEMFLDSAVKRNSAVSIGKHLGYTPVSARGAKATISFNVTSPSGSPSSLTLDRFTSFNTTIGTTPFTFVNLESKIIEPSNGVYSFSEIQVTQGSPLTISYTVVSPGPAEKYEIPNQNIDTTSIYVRVQNSAIDTTSTTYTLSTDTLNLNSNSKVFFLEENSLGNYQIYFGDGVLGKQLAAGNIVNIQYIVTDGISANVSGNIDQAFTSSALIGGGSIDAITTVVNSTGGADKETIESIKFRAPKFLSAYNRAVTEDDYKAIIEQQFPLIESISVWGGEENDPPLYGKVIISLKPYEGYAVSESVKEQIRTAILSSKKVLAITPEFVDPDYMYINVNTRVAYDPKLTTLSSNDIKGLIITSINNYFSGNLQQFSEDFEYSRFVNAIDNTNTSILNNITVINLQRRLIPVVGVNYSYTDSESIKFRTAIQPGTVRSTRFNVSIDDVIYPAIIKDVPSTNPNSLIGTGTLKLYNPDTNDVLDSDYGTVDYASGSLEMPLVNVYGFPSDITDVRLNVDIQDSFMNIVATKNVIIKLDDTTSSTISNKVQGLTVNVVAV